MRRLAPSLLLAFALLLVAAARGAATPFTSHFGPLVAEVNARDADLPLTGLTAAQKRERAALDRCYRALSADSQGLSGDIAMARKMAAALASGYPADGVFEGLVADLDDALAADVHAEREATVVLISIAKAGALRTRAEG